MASMEDSESEGATRGYDHLLKLVMLGASGCGKTSLVRRFMEDTFDSLYLTTVVVDFKMRNLTLRSGKMAKLQVWDTSGRDRHVHFFENFMRGATAAIFCFDVTSRRSFEALTKWFALVDSVVNNDNVTRVLVACKADLRDDECVSLQEAETLATENNCRFMDTSAKEDRNVDELFEDIAHIVLNSMDEEEETKEKNKATMRKRSDNNVLLRMTQSLRRRATTLRHGDAINASSLNTHQTMRTEICNSTMTKTTTTSTSSCCTIS